MRENIDCTSAKLWMCVQRAAGADVAAKMRTSDADMSVVACCSDHRNSCCFGDPPDKHMYINQRVLESTPRS